MRFVCFSGDGRRNRVRGVLVARCGTKDVGGGEFCEGMALVARDLVVTLN